MMIKLRHLVGAFFLVLYTLPVNSQPPGNPGGDPDEVPISGLGWLLALGIGLGIRFLKKK